MTTNTLTVTLASGDALDVRDFAVDEGLSRLFDVSLTALSTSVDVDFEGSIGQPARFEVLRTSAVDGETRYWSGICVHAGLVGVEETGLSHYRLRIVPRMWLLTQRRNYRLFQDQSELDVVLAVLAEWGIEPTLHLDAASYPKRRVRTQYAETDFDFVNRLLEDIGVTYYFEQVGGDTVLILADAPNKGAARAPVVFVATPNPRLDVEHVTALRTHREVRPGRYTQSDVDYRKALNYPLASSSSLGNAVENQLERYHHNYGSFLWKADAGGDTPVADDRGAARTDEKAGAAQVQKRLQAQRIDARVCSFATTAHDLRPGKVFTITGHPRDEVAAPLLVVAGTFCGTSSGEWSHSCETRYTDVDYRPQLRTPKPRTNGVESATVTGPAGEEIHTDEFGRVRVKFHWDREGADDETSSCWVPVSQAWAGAGFGAVSLARVGQEVLVDFLGADPDRPVVVGRVFTTTTPPPYQLPKYKMVSGHRSESYPRPQSAPPQARLGGGLPAPPYQPFVDPVPQPAASMGATPMPPARPVSMGETPMPPARPVSMGATPMPPARPAGGGMPVGGLGAGAPAAAAPGEKAAAVVTATDNPGPRGGSQASLAELTAAIRQHGSPGPDENDHNRSANALVHDDTAGAEAMYLQAQRSFYKTVKADFVGVVGANRAFTVISNDTTLVGGFEVTEVGLDRKVAVGGKQTHVVAGDISVQGFGNIGCATPKGAQVYLAKEGLVLRAGGDDGPSASILIFPDAIVIDAPKTYINPGSTMMASIYQGKSVDQAAHDQESEDRVQKATQAMLLFARDHGVHTPAGEAATQQMLHATATTGYGLTPMSDAARTAVPGLTSSEVATASARSSNIMYGTPLPR